MCYHGEQHGHDVFIDEVLGEIEQDWSIVSLKGCAVEKKHNLKKKKAKSLV